MRKKPACFPSHIGEWLGFSIDTYAFQFTVPRCKLDKLLKLVDAEISRKYSSAGGISKSPVKLSPWSPVWAHSRGCSLEKCTNFLTDVLLGMALSPSPQTCVAKSCFGRTILTDPTAARLNTLTRLLKLCIRTPARTVMEALSWIDSGTSLPAALSQSRRSERALVLDPYYVSSNCINPAFAGHTPFRTLALLIKF